MQPGAHKAEGAPPLPLARLTLSGAGNGAAQRSSTTSTSTSITSSSVRAVQSVPALRARRVAGSAPRATRLLTVTANSSSSTQRQQTAQDRQHSQGPKSWVLPLAAAALVFHAARATAKVRLARVALIYDCSEQPLVHWRTPLHCGTHQRCRS
jgi:hypothetical protein